MSNNSLADNYICLAVVASQTCQVAKNSEKNWTCACCLSGHAMGAERLYKRKQESRFVRHV